MYMYFGKDHKYTDINDARCTSFFKSPDPKLNHRILSRGALLEHVKRSAYQAGWLWAECLANVILPDPTLWGWKLHTESQITESHNKYVPRWETNETKESNIDAVTATCSCKTNHCPNCMCGTSGKKCLEYCKCQRMCKNV